MQLRNTIIAGALALLATEAFAGGFVELPTSAPLRKFGANNPNVDQFKLNEGDILSTDGFGINTYDYPAFLELLEPVRTTEWGFGGEEIGEVHDMIFRDKNDGKLVFGVRVTMESDGEINDIQRYGFAGFSAAAAWVYLKDTDLRLYSASRTNAGLLEYDTIPEEPFDPDVIDMRSDLNVDEGNPDSGLFLLKTNATNYIVKEGAIRLYQAGEEFPDVPQSAFVAGYAPVPEPSTYALLLGGLGLVGVIARRRSAK